MQSSTSDQAKTDATGATCQKSAFAQFHAESTNNEAASAKVAAFSQKKSNSIGSRILALVATKAGR